jgi:hypothetical protein
MIYVLVRNQGGGCDYTIGCGIAVTTLDAKNEADALVEARIHILQDNFHDETRLESAMLLAVESRFGLPIKHWYAEEQERRDAEEKYRKELNERAEFERLSAKFKP